MELIEEKDDVSSDSEMEVCEYHNRNDLHQDGIRYYSTIENGEEVIYAYNDQIPGFYTGEMSSEAVCSAMGNSGEIDHQIPCCSTSEYNSEFVSNTDRQDVDDQLQNMNLSECSISYVDQHEFKHRITHKNRPHSTEIEENSAGSTTNVQFTSEDYFNKTGKSNLVNLKEGVLNNQCDSVSSEIFSQDDELDKSKEEAMNNLVLSFVERYVSEMSANEGQMNTDEGFVAKINEYIDSFVQSIGESDIDKNHEKEINDEIETMECVRTNEETLCEDEEMYQMFEGKGYNAEIYQTIQDILNCIETNENNLPVIIVKREGREKLYAILYQDPWEVAYLSMHDDINSITEMQVNIITGKRKKIISIKNPNLFKTVGKKTKEKAVTENADTIKNVYVTQKDGNILYKVREGDVVKCGTKTNEEVREIVQLEEMSISKIICVEINKKTGTEKFNSVKEFIVARKDGDEKVYDISDPKHKVHLVQPKNSKKNKKETKKNKKKSKKNKKKCKKNKRKTKKNKRKTKKNKKKTKKNKKKIKKHKKESTKPNTHELTHRTVKKNLQISLSETCEREAKDEGKKKSLPTVLRIMKTKEANVSDKEQLVKKVGLSKKQEKKSAHKANKKVKVKMNKKSKKKYMSRIIKELARNLEQKKELSNEEEFAIGNLVDYFVEEQISKVCFDFHRAAKFEYFCNLEDFPKDDDENYALLDENQKGKEVIKKQSKGGRKAVKELTCSWHEGKSHGVKGLMKHLAIYTGDTGLTRKARTVVNYCSNPSKKPPQRTEKKEIVLPPHEPTCPPRIKTLSALKQVFKDLENKELKKRREETKIAVDVFSEEKGLTGQKLSKKKDTMKRKLNQKTIGCDLSDNSKGQVEKNKKESKKKMHGSNQEEDKGQEKNFEEYERCLEEDDEIAKQKILDLTTHIHLLEQKERIENEETISGCFSENIETAKEEQENKKSKKTDVEGMTKNKEIDKNLLENIEKRGGKEKESKKRKREEIYSEINGKVTMDEENEVFQHKIKKMRSKETICLLSKGKNMIKNKKESKTVSKQEPVLRKRKKSTNSDSSFNQKLYKRKLKLSKVIQKQIEFMMEKKHKSSIKRTKESKNRIDKQLKNNNKSGQKMDASVKKSKDSKKIEEKSKETNKNALLKRSQEVSKEKIECSKEKIEEYSLVYGSSEIFVNKIKEKNEKLTKGKAKVNSVLSPSLNNENQDLFKNVKHVDYDIEKTNVTTVKSPKKKIQKVKNQSCSKSQGSKEIKAKPNLAMQNRIALMKLGIVHSERQLLKNQNIKNSTVHTKSNSSKPTEKFTEKKEKEKSNILDETEEIIPKNNLHKRKYDSASEDGSGKNDSDVTFKESSGESDEGSDSNDTEYIPGQKKTVSK